MHSFVVRVDIAASNGRTVNEHPASGSASSDISEFNASARQPQPLPLLPPLLELPRPPKQRPLSLLMFTISVPRPVDHPHLHYSYHNLRGKDCDHHSSNPHPRTQLPGDLPTTIITSTIPISIDVGSVLTCLHSTCGYIAPQPSHQCQEPPHIRNICLHR
nr:unnamed protein product [Spirometra erinaceieuropaei]